jgi:large subunit ribosomal protein L24
MWIRTNDTVVIIRGEDRGTRGKVLRRIRDKSGNGADRVVVEGVNRVYRHVRRSQRNPQGGRLSVEMPIPQSNVALLCQACSKPTRVGARFLQDGAKERYCKKCGASVGLISPAKSAQGKS